MRGTLTLEEAAKFHGHRGPWLVLGYRAGLRALEVLGSGVRCSVRLPLRAPYTCLIDGIQASAGCTLGKRLIEVCEGEGVVVRFTAGGRALELRLREGVEALIEGLVEGLGLEGAAREVEGWDLGEAFEERQYP
ncbi:MAG: formylmethanofuran dehydrogenase subunit E family protein [Candidatus Nezhaarchaeales archaeon]